MGQGTGLPTVEEREQRFEDIEPQQATTRIQTFPVQMSYEAKYGLELLKDSELQPEKIVAIVEPLARAIGWAEALAYSADKQTEARAVEHLINSGQFVPAGKNGQ
jgi:hypothetical protein